MENIGDLKLKHEKQQHGPLNPVQKQSEEEEKFLRRQTAIKNSDRLERGRYPSLCERALRRQVAALEAFLVVHLGDHLASSKPAVVERLDGPVHLGHL